jgi:hypothetical protein
MEADTGFRLRGATTAVSGVILEEGWRARRPSIDIAPHSALCGASWPRRAHQGILYKRFHSGAQGKIREENQRGKEGNRGGTQGRPRIAGLSAAFPGELPICGPTQGDSRFCYDKQMRDFVILFVHVVATLAPPVSFLPRKLMTSLASEHKGLWLSRRGKRSLRSQ